MSRDEGVGTESRKRPDFWNPSGQPANVLLSPQAQRGEEQERAAKRACRRGVFDRAATKAPVCVGRGVDVR